ncbi:DUF3885 domain-containing protein [Ureibacillus sp. GCM10028918]
MKLEDYLEESFPNLLLEPPLFYNWEIGIRFELGDPKEENDTFYLDRVYNRSKTLFAAIHDDEDELFIVAQDFRRIVEKRKRKRAKFFISFLREKNLKYSIQHQILPLKEEDEEELAGWCKHQFSLQCQVKDINPSRLVNAIFSTKIPRIYMLNLTKGTIFSIYDSRGCDLVATKKETIEGIYNKYNDWILDYDRKQIDGVFV